MTVKPVTNVRSPEQWEIIKQHVVVEGKVIADLGCGYGDLDRMMLDAGARRVDGVDIDPGVEPQISGSISYVIRMWANSIEEGRQDPFDVGICFSVIPYLEEDEVLELVDWLKEHCDITLLEIQEKGDGPGFMTYEQIESWLRSEWDHVEPIGRTLVDYRSMYRTIWMCHD